MLLEFIHIISNYLKLLNSNQIKLMKSEESFINTANMATTPFFIQQLAPAKLKKGDEIEYFIEKCEEFFKVAHCSSNDAEILVKCFMEEDMLRIYNRVDSDIKGYPTKLRTAFTTESNLLEEMRAALDFKQRNEDPQEFFEKVEKLADRIFTRKLTRETFIELLLVEASKEKDLQRQLIMSNTVGIEGVKEKIKKLHLVQLKTETKIMAIRTTQQGNRNYAEVVRKQDYTQNPYRPRETATRYNVYKRAGESQRYKPQGEIPRHRERIQGTMTCWTCQEEGHISRDCSKRVIMCFACKQQGHIRRNCPTIKCRRCQNNGHEEAQCFTNLERKRLGYTYENRQQDRDTRRFQGSYHDTNGREYRYLNRHIAYVNQDREDQGRNSRVSDNRYDINASEELQGDEHPNEYASSEGGLIGAIH